MSPEQIQTVVGFTIGLIGAGWAGHAIGYVRGYRQARLVYQEAWKKDLTEAAIDDAPEAGVASAAFQPGEGHG